MRIVTFGTYEASVHPRVQVLIEGLREHGDQVTEVNVPLGLDTAARVAMLRQPWRLPRLIWRLLRCWAILILRTRRAIDVATVDVVLVGYLGHFDIHLARWLFRDVPVVLDLLLFASDTAEDRGERGRVKQLLLRMVDSAALRVSDLVLVDTEEHLARLPVRHRSKGVVIPVGATQSWFRAGEARAEPSCGPLRVIFFGLYTPLQGTPTIATALRDLNKLGIPVEALMIGSGQDYGVARAAAGDAPVAWREWVPPNELPGLVASYDVCLGIFGAGSKARRVVPNKVYQGAAAGCAIVTSDTPPQRRIVGDIALLVEPEDPAGLATALRQLSMEPAELRLRQGKTVGLARSSFTPAAVVAILRARVGLLSRADGR